MPKWTSLLMLALCVVVVSAVVVATGQDFADGQSTNPVAESWSSFETAIGTRAEHLDKESHSHNWATLDVISSDIVRSPSLKYPIIGILEIQAHFAEDSTVRKAIPGGSSSPTLSRIVSYRLRFSPKDRTWALIDGVATMVWSVDDGSDHAGEKAKLDLKSPSSRFGMDLIALLVNENAD